MLPVIATRLRPPTRAGAAVPREVLPTALEHLRSRRLLLVRAPAGYGKSLLMAQLHDALRAGGEAAVGWISVGEIGASLAEVAMHCASALSRIVPGLDSAMQTLFEAQRNVSPETIGAMLCNELERADGNGFLFVDDLHAIAGTPGEHLYECLLRDAPERMHFAIASRTEPGFSVARLTAPARLASILSVLTRVSVRSASARDRTSRKPYEMKSPSLATSLSRQLKFRNTYQITLCDDRCTPLITLKPT
ncbi:MULTISPECIES: hypothetical protein [Burkholderia]|uniref:LuxR family transcriptional regulator n=1 Tax=Burkholderia aenigmatica TaxID=2015348 RepID=A0A6J5ITX8_9BURK|nr:MULTISPECIES: hypothetical protein [Burkholderia]CAB3962089.1 LuxR family transcriptional regulator [Burkholderia aenigmatica]